VNERIKGWYERQDKISVFLSLFVFLASFVAYLRTMAPTASFWDCGEFIACSYILGIPHPPGTPLFILIGRVFSLIPLFSEIAARINFLSALTSALTVWLCYLLIIKLVSYWEKQNPSLWIKMGKYVGGVAGSLFLAFSVTFWSNAVEAEVYGTSMLLMLLILYLGLLWMDKRGTPKGDRLLILISYLGLLSTGIHMTAFMIMPAIFLLVVLVDKEKLLDWRFWITGLVLALVMHSLTPFLIFMGGWLFLTFILMQVSSKKKAWALSFLIIFVGMIGYSTQLFIPIRSSLEPAIDENNPSDWQSLKAFLERKQYGQQSMIARMFYRRGTWVSQFGAKERMGFWGFFREQFMEKKLWFIPLFLGLLGIWEQIRKRKREGTVLLFLILACTVGLILYMNFADGTKPDPLTGEIIYIEVRDRDYFFTPGYMFFALAMGLGISALLAFLGSWLEIGWDEMKKRALPKTTAERLSLSVFILLVAFIGGVSTGGGLRGFAFAFILALGLFILRLIVILLLANLGSLLNLKKGVFAKPVVGILSVIILALLILPVNRSLHSHNNRSGNYLPYDYAWNLLQSCDKDAILFTNGDNDTFPLWFLQNVEKVRQDVRVVNLSLINTNWYIKQMKNQWGVPISFSDREIDRLNFVRTEDGKILRIQDRMIDDILETNNWKYPIYFAVTVAGDNRIYKGKPIDSHMRMEGMAYRVVKEEGNMMVEPEIMRDKLFNVFRFRGINDPKVYKDDNDERLLANYTSCFLGLADTLRRAKQYDEAIQVAKRVTTLLPTDWRPYAYLMQLYGESDQPQDSIDKVFQQANRVVQSDEELKAQNFMERLYFNLGYTYKQRGQTQKAIDSMNRILSFNKSFRPALEALVSIYYANKDKGELTKLFETWVSNNPTDAQAAAMLTQLRSPDFKFENPPQ
jgi:tetratricopeptide (TPR) repeat protein